MTRTIPQHMQHLRRDRRGLPVPYINQWGAESVERYRLDYDTNVARLAVWLDDDPNGDPDFTRQHMGRQRECATQGLCQVCRAHVPWSRRFLAVAAMSVERITVPGVSRDEVAVITEPWLCQRCAEFAATTCPDLIRRTRDESLSIVAITSKTQVRLVVSTGYIDGPLEAWSRRMQPAMWVKVHVPALLIEEQEVARV